MLKFAKKIYAKLRMAKYKRSLRKKVVFDPNTFVSTNTVFEGGNRVAEGAVVKGCQIGYGTIIGHDSDISNTRVGRYSSICVKIVRGRHPVDHVSTHPAFYSLAAQAGFTYAENQLFDEYKYADEKTKTSVIIGSDVWITRGVSIVEGVTVGDGAVILNNAVVTKDVPPYAIVGGVPAKVVRYRFDEETIAWLNELKWWNKGEEWIKAHADCFSDPMKLKKTVEKEEN